MLKIKLVRTGKRNQPSYRIVVAEAKSKLQGKYLELLGHYDPLQNPHLVRINKEKYLSWIKKGAQPTKRVSSLIKAVL